MTSFGRKPHIIHILDGFGHGGAQRVALDIGRLLNGDGFHVSFVGEEGPSMDEFCAEFPVFSHRGRGIQSIGSVLNAARSTPGPVVLHSHQRREALYALMARRCLRRQVGTVEHAHTLLPTSAYAGLSYRSDRVLAVSSEIEKRIRDEFHRGPTRVLLVPNAPSRARILDRLNPWMPGQPLRVLGAGRLAMQKNPARFVNVIAAMARVRDVQAKWIGDGELMHTVLDLSRSLHAPVHFAGHSDNVEATLDESDVLLITSDWEGTPLIALEAMARGIPVVATSVGGLTSLLSDDRGLLIRPEWDPISISARVLESISDSKAVDSIRMRAWSHVIETSSDHKRLSLISRAYEESLAQQALRGTRRTRETR